jgi:hypothetical protein
MMLPCLLTSSKDTFLTIKIASSKVARVVASDVRSGLRGVKSLLMVRFTTGLSLGDRRGARGLVTSVMLFHRHGGGARRRTLWDFVSFDVSGMLFHLCGGFRRGEDCLRCLFGGTTFE